MAAAIVVLKPGVSFTTLLVVAALGGVGGGNFASSTANINAFYRGHRELLHPGAPDAHTCASSAFSGSATPIYGTTWIFRPMPWRKRSSAWA
jgi:hypothetical protein